jgi:AAA family ATP:ADP antiporter
MIKNSILNFINTTTRIKPDELRATVLSFIFVFLLMTAYFILRPVRDAMSSDWNDTELSWLWTSTFFFSFIAVSLYGEIISRIKLNYVVPGVYLFFAASFFLFNFLTISIQDADIVNKFFYVWLSVFSLFHVSVFWSFISGIFSQEQGPRLFSFIASGASIGAILGPSIPIIFANQIDTMNFLIIAGFILLIPIPIIRFLEKFKFSDDWSQSNLDGRKNNAINDIIDRDFLSGFKVLMKDPFLVSIALFILFYVVMNTFVYFELRKLLVEFDRETRTQIWASIDLIVNILAIITAIFITNRMTNRLGMSTTLAFIPILMILGWLVVAVSPVLLFLIGLQILRRAGNYAITKPGREMLFTLVNNDVRYKAKPVIDIVVYRGGDMLTAWFYTLLTASFGLGLTGISIFASIIGVFWAYTGFYLGRKYNSTKKNTGT